MSLSIIQVRVSLYMIKNNVAEYNTCTRIHVYDQTNVVEYNTCTRIHVYDQTKCR